MKVRDIEEQADTIARILDTALSVPGLRSRVGFDPLVGMLADRTNTRWGKFRPYVLLGAPALAVSAVLAFTKPSLRPLAHEVWLRTQS